ncbi:hypothetical protein FCM35_KLT00740 [Carex littledalei]|uniref:Uncharacterized protein n=1 Tax=Carex littledalei TaxID=544730 RepID=A0A833VIJ8_9POAL|nr:hypothetical protein FCM35_KLT00740 [Carex littledalei]
MSPEETGLAMSVIASNISASSNLASLSIALSSLIGAWAGSTSSIFTNSIIFGDTGQTIASVKYIALLVCFLAAFTCFIQSTRYYVHASFLMSTLDSDIPVSYVQTAIIRGGNFWSMGLRALYFATTLLLWIFGPIPMFACSVFMVVILHVLDSNSTPLHNYQYRSVKNVSNHGKNSVVKREGMNTLPNSNVLLSNPMYSPINYVS